MIIADELYPNWQEFQHSSHRPVHLGFSYRKDCHDGRSSAPPSLSHPNSYSKFYTVWRYALKTRIRKELKLKLPTEKFIQIVNFLGGFNWNQDLAVLAKHWVLWFQFWKDCVLWAIWRCYCPLNYQRLRIMYVLVAILIYLSIKQQT